MFVVIEVVGNCVQRVFIQTTWKNAVKRAIKLVGNILEENDQEPVDVADIEEHLENSAFYEISDRYNVQIAKSDN